MTGNGHNFFSQCKNDQCSSKNPHVAVPEKLTIILFWPKIVWLFHYGGFLSGGGHLSCSQDLHKSWYIIQYNYTETFLDTGWLVIRIMTSKWCDMSSHRLSFQWASEHHKNATRPAGQVQNGHHQHIIECNFFSCRDRAEKLLTHTLKRILIFNLNPA